MARKKVVSFEQLQKVPAHTRPFFEHVLTVLGVDVEHVVFTEDDDDDDQEDEF